MQTKWQIDLHWQLWLNSKCTSLPAWADVGVETVTCSLGNILPQAKNNCKNTQFISLSHEKNGCLHVMTKFLCLLQMLIISHYHIFNLQCRQTGRWLTPEMVFSLFKTQQISFLGTDTGWGSRISCKKKKSNVHYNRMHSAKVFAQL